MSTNLMYDVDYDYERSECTCDESICRCTTVTRTWINSINVVKVINTLYQIYKYKGFCFDKYCFDCFNKYYFDRICHIFKIYDKDNYEVKTGYGYYGEEICGVWFDNENEIINAYDRLCQFSTDLEKIKFCLELEYGYLIDSVKTAISVYIVQTSPNEIHLPQMEYFKKVDKTVIEYYKGLQLPVAVCIKQDNHYKLVDGYHRFVANKDRDFVDIIVLE